MQKQLQLKWKSNVFYEISWKRILYTVCFIVLCVIDQRTKTGSGLDGWLETFRDLMGVIMACMILIHYKVEDFKRWKTPYLIWSVLSVIGGIGAFLWGIDRRPFLNDWIVVILDVILFGYIIIHTFISVIIENKLPKLEKGFGIVWAIMMLLMIVSRSDYSWPLCYMIMFGCFCLTDFTREERMDLFHGSLNGIICSFFLFQGYCLMFRPYDIVRYTGIYNNPNLNALFYVEVLCAVFIKVLYVTKKKACKGIRIFYWLGVGVLLSFLFMTIGRTAWMVAFLFGILFLILWNKLMNRKRFLINGIVMVLCACLMFPLCYGLVRYVPPMFHHPVWFWGEWSDERAHSWDAWDSEKYIDMEELMQNALGRVTVILGDALKNSPFLIKADAADATETTPEDDLRMRAAVLTPEEGEDPILVRNTIYKHYWQNLNWFGHRYEEQGFQLTWRYWIGHAHNIYLQYGTDFGIPVMILFVILLIWGSAMCLWRGVRCRSVEFGIIEIMASFFILVPALFGILEYSWGVSSLSITMLFISWSQAMQAESWQSVIHNEE
ncbi:MAG: O-antigen ligase family protein [Candidatus Gastranaerophilales bacterium]|nr:O-antigen ligase family protein [Candidatus Gastranaerophilales bacterium]